LIRQQTSCSAAALMPGSAAQSLIGARMNRRSTGAARR